LLLLLLLLPAAVSFAVVGAKHRVCSVNMHIADNASGASKAAALVKQSPTVPNWLAAALPLCTAEGRALVMLLAVAVQAAL
jgi:hypothetical protein